MQKKALSLRHVFWRRRHARCCRERRGLAAHGEGLPTKHALHQQLHVGAALGPILTGAALSLTSSSMEPPCRCAELLEVALSVWRVLENADLDGGGYDGPFFQLMCSWFLALLLLHVTPDCRTETSCSSLVKSLPVASTGHGRLKPKPMSLA